MHIEARKNKNGTTYRYVIHYADLYGRKQRYTKGGFRTKKAAREAGTKKEAEILAGGLPTSSKTVTNVFDEWLELNDTRLANSTITAYVSIFKNHIEPVMGDCPIDKLGFFALQKFFNDREDHLKSTNTHLRTTLGVIFSHAIRCGYIKDDPTKNLKVVGQKSKKREKYVSPEKLELLSEEVQKCRNLSRFQKRCRTVFLYTGYYTGLRLGELLGLKFEDIDWENHMIYPRRQAHKGGIVSERLKTRASYDPIPICQTIYDILAEWRKDNWYDFVFPTDEGECLNPSSMETFFTRLSRDAGFDFCIHMLRHSFATNLHAAGVDPVTASKLTRHASVDVLANIYTHPQYDILRDALKQAFDPDLKA